MVPSPPAPAKRQLSPVLAGVFSLGIHGAVLGIVVVKSHLAPVVSEAQPMRLGGQTFDVDALGDPSDSEVAPASPPPAPAAEEGAEAQEETSPEVPAEPVEPPSEPSPEVPSETPAPPDDQGETIPEAVEAPAPLDEKPKPTPPRDPFDLEALPGEANKVEAPPSGSDSSLSPQGAYGAAGVESTVVDVYAAFLRQIPLAAKSDATWSHLPFGDAGRIEFVITVDKEGRLGPIQIVEDERFPAPAHMKRVLPLAAKFLAHARVSLNTTREGGSQRLAITAVVHRRAPDEDKPDAAGVRAFGLKGNERPTGVYFTYFSGQHIEIEMWRLP